MALTDKLTLWSRLQLALWRALKLKRDFTGRLANGMRLSLRPPPTRDLELAEQVFGAGIYRPPRELPEAPRIVDTNAGVGLAELDWLAYRPNAAIIAFEEHPNRTEAFVENAELNAFWDHVLLHPHQAGTADGAAALEHDEEGFASIFKKGGAARYQNVKRVDFFKMVGEQPIALLKLRMKGAEQPILADARFGGLKVDQVLIEGVTPESRGWAEQRLAELGFRTRPGASAGMLWAARS